MASLIYPLVQVTLGTVGLIPTPRYFPFHAHCTEALMGLAEATKTFIPVVPLILKPLTSVEVRV